MRSKVHNYGIDILRIVAAFLVVSGHFGGGIFLPTLGGKVPLAIAVPCFMLISFYLAHDRILVRNVRYGRLARIFICWGLLYMAYAWACGEKLTFAGVVKQLLFGVGYCNPLYYLMNVGVILFAFSLCLTKAERLSMSINEFHLAIAGCGVVFILFQYLGLHKLFVSKLFGWDFFVMHSIGYMAELVPFAISGYLIRHFEGRCPLRLWYLFSIMSCLCGLFAMVCLPLPSGFGYHGVGLLLLSNGLFAICLRLHIHSALKGIIKRLAALTLGCYVLHLAVGGFLKWQMRACHINDFVMAGVKFVSSLAATALLYANRRLRWLVQ